MAPLPHDRLIADALADYQSRLDAGESPRADEYAARLGDAYPAFCRVAAVEDALVGILHGHVAERQVTEGHVSAPHLATTGTAGDPEPRLRLLGRRTAFAAAAVLLLGLGIVLFGGGGGARSDAGHLEIRSVPVARVLIDDEEAGTTPLDISLAPGAHDITLEQDGFAPRALRSTIQEGKTSAVDEILVPLDLEDGRSLALLEQGLLGDAAGARLPAWYHERSGASGGYLLPAGRVRPSDLDRLAGRLGEDLPLHSRLVFRRVQPDGTEGAILHEQPYEVTSATVDLPLPEAIREAVTPGARIEWSIEGDDGSAVRAQLEVVAEIETPTQAIRALEARMEAAGLPEQLRAWLGARLLLAQELPFAAYRRVQPACLDHEADGASILPCVARWEAVRAMGLDESPLGQEVRSAIVGYGRERRLAFFRSTSGR